MTTYCLLEEKKLLVWFGEHDIRNKNLVQKLNFGILKLIDNANLNFFQ